MDHAFEAGDRFQAFHTNAPVLTPAAYEDFGRAVDTLLRLGRFDEAVLLWADCVEIQHFPPAINGRAGHGGLPACRVAPCVDMACQRCRDCRGGHQFPLAGTFTRAAVVAEAGSTAAEAWARVHGNPQCLREVDLLRIRRMRYTCSRATFTVSSCRLLSRMVLGRLTRKKQQGYRERRGSGCYLRGLANQGSARG